MLNQTPFYTYFIKKKDKNQKIFYCFLLFLLFLLFRFAKLKKLLWICFAEPPHFLLPSVVKKLNPPIPLIPLSIQ
jgi:hypothetical protein